MAHGTRFSRFDFVLLANQPYVPAAVSAEILAELILIQSQAPLIEAA
jgi:hypothetical protein